MIYNLTRKKCLSRLPVFADTFIIRCRGMIGHDFRDFDAMVFNHCNAIHTLFMSIPLDVIFLDHDNQVCALRHGLRPWRPLARCGRAYAVIELPRGILEQTGTVVGDYLDLNAELTREAAETLRTRDKLINSMETVIPFEESKR